jgi:8-amino-3,8-dideoxy-alpha-D-manno-octulosonate transaminase
MSDEAASPRFPREFPGVHYYGKEEEEAALAVIRARSPFRYYGANFLAEADALEKEFAGWLGRRHAQAVSSCTNALVTAMAALEVGPGQEVLVPGFFWVSTVGAIVRAGAIPVLVEVDDSFTMDPEDLRRKITPHSRLVLPVHMCGIPANMPAILEVAREHRLAVLEDCAQALGAKLHGQASGTTGDVAVFSFQMNKNITAGEGGMLVTDDQRLFLRANAAHDIGVPWEKGMPFDAADYVLWGAGARMSELSAAVVRVQLGKLNAITSHMRDSKWRIRGSLQDLPGVTWRRVDDPAGDSGPFLIASFGSADQAARFAEECGRRSLSCGYLAHYGLHVYYNVRALVEHRSNSPDGFPWTHPANVPLLRNYGPGALPRTDELLSRSVGLPIPSCLTPEQETDFITLFREAHAATL